MGHRDAVILISLALLLLYPQALVHAVKLSIVIAPSRTVVQGQRVRVSCYIDNVGTIKMSRFSLYLYCPVFAPPFSCFQNCVPSCVSCPQQGQLNTYSCNRYPSGSSLTFEYTMARAEKRHSGEYHCAFFGLTSSKKRLNVIDPPVVRPASPPAPVKPAPRPAPKPLPPPRRPAHPPTRPLPPVRPSSRSRVPIPITKAPSRPATGSDPARSRPDPDGGYRGGERERTYGRGVKGLVEMGERLLFVVVVLFLVSLIINSVFCIRCVLIYFYGTDIWRKVRMGSVLCMNEEIRVIRELKGYGSIPYPNLEPAFTKCANGPQSTAPLLGHPPVLRRQRSADPPHPRLSYQQPPQVRSRPSSQQSDVNNGTGPRVMRVVSEIELQPGEELDEQTVMYVPLPVVVQRNGNVPSGNGMSRRPLSVFFQPGQEARLSSSRPRLSSSVSGIDRIRRSSQELPHRMLSIESVFEMETLHE